MVKLSEETKALYLDNIKKGSWIPWEKFLTLKPGDIINLPHYDSNDNLIGKEIIIISSIERQKSTFQESFGLEMGHFSGKYSVVSNDGIELIEEGGISGILSVNMEQLEETKTTKPNNITTTLDKITKKAYELYPKEEEYDYEMSKFGGGLDYVDVNEGKRNAFIMGAKYALGVL